MRGYSGRHSSFDRRFNFFGWFINIFVGIVFVVVFGGFAFTAYDYLIAEKFSIRKDEFTCTASHIEQVQHRDDSGFVTTTQYSVCDQYTRKS